jgi:hypothetical protein
VSHPTATREERDHEQPIQTECSVSPARCFRVYHPTNTIRTICTRIRSPALVRHSVYEGGGGEITVRNAWGVIPYGRDMRRCPLRERLVVAALRAAKPAEGSLTQRSET